MKKLKHLNNFFLLLFYMETKIHPPNQNQLYYYKFPHPQYIFIKGFKVLLHFIFSGWLMPTLRLPVFTSENTSTCAQLDYKKNC